MNDKLKRILTIIIVILMIAAAIALGQIKRLYPGVLRSVVLRLESMDVG